MKIKIFITNSVLLILFSIIALSMILGCRVLLKKSDHIAVPEFRYPGMESRNNLSLVSVITDPYGSSFLQGRLSPEHTDGKHNFKRPFALTSNSDGFLFFLDHARGIVYRLDIDSNGTLINTSVFPSNRRQFPSLIDLALDPNGYLWLVDSKLKKVFKIDESGKIVDSVSEIFDRPIGITYHQSSSTMLVSDLVSNSIFSFSLDGKLITSYDAESGHLLESPSFIATDESGRIYVVEALTSTIKIFRSDWTLERSIGGIGDGPGYFAKPKGIAIDKQKRIYVADALFDNIQVFDSSGFLLITLGTTGDGAGEFWQPTGVLIDERQQLYVADSYNRRVQVFRWETED